MARTSMRQVLVTLAAGFALSVATAYAQTSVIRGKVTDAGTQRPLIGVQVTVPSTGQGTLTNAEGDFALGGILAGTRMIQITMIGYKTVERNLTLMAGTTTTANVELTQTAIAMDELVVTGTAGAVSKRTVGNAIVKIDAADIAAKTTSSTVTDLLQAKTPGLTLLANTGTPGAASEIRIRGASSFMGNKPVIYVDGVKFNINDLGTFTPSGAATTSYQGQQTSAFDLISPQDIESIEVIKGPAAATLYGADAAGGVIQIMTKKGARGVQPLRFDVRSELAANDWHEPMPANYTTCTQAYLTSMMSNGQPYWPGCVGKTAGSQLIDTPLKRDPAALNTGTVQRLSVTARGGSDRFSYYVSTNLENEDGVFLNSWNDRSSIRANFSAAPSGKVDFSVSSSYVHGFLRLPVGDEAAQGLILSAMRGRPGYTPALGDTARSGWGSTTPKMANDYNNTTKTDRYTVASTINIKPAWWFRNRLTLGLDYTASLAAIVSPPGSVDADYAGLVNSGIVSQRYPRTYNYTIDYSGNADVKLLPNLLSTTSVGLQALKYHYERVQATGTGFGAEDVTLIGSAATTTGANAFSESNSLGYYVQEQLGLNNRLFVTGALRADDHSAFGSNFDVLIYPKASLSWIMSEEPMLTKTFETLKVNSFKLRGAWGQAGKAPSPFSATQTYSVSKYAAGTTTVGSALMAFAYGNPDLKAERGSEIEVGFDAGAWNDRVGLEFTYYSKKTKDVISSASPGPSTGFAGTFYTANTGTGSLQRNLGKIDNSGVELGLTVTPVTNRKLNWESRITLATNSNKLVDFGDARVREAVSGQSYGTTQYHREGYPLGGYWAYKVQRNSDGTPKLDAAGRVILADSLSYIGSPVPTREIGWSNTLTIMRNLRLFVLVDYKGGSYLFNYREYGRCRSQRNCERMNNANNVDLTTGPVLTSGVWTGVKNPEVYAWYGTGFRAGGATSSVFEPWIEKTDFLKFRDVSLAYMLPAKYAQMFRATTATFTIAGHNLGVITDYSGWDPEVNSYNGSAYSGSGFVRADVYAPPMLRRLSASLTLGF